MTSGGRVFLYAPNGKMPVPLRDVLDQRLPIVFVRSMDQWFPVVEFYCTTASLKAKGVVWAAAAAGTYPVTLPEQNGWLADQVWQRCAAGLDSRIFLATHAGEPAYIPYQAG